jgi:hypothetical protein
MHAMIMSCHINCHACIRLSLIDHRRTEDVHVDYYDDVLGGLVFPSF